jgi:regulator of cell morphogenesis and NO signaling
MIMNSTEIQQSVGEIAAQLPGASQVFESLRIDYCCGGKETLADVCQRKGLDPDEVLLRLQESSRAASGSALITSTCATNCLAWQR